MSKGFRYVTKTKPSHPTVMVEDDGKNGVGYNVTHHPSPKIKGTWHQLLKNPNPDEKDQPSYLVHKRWKGRIGKGGTFTANKIKGFKLDPRDERDVDLIEKAKKQGKPWDAYNPRCLGDEAYRARKKAQRRKRRRRFLRPLLVMVVIAMALIALGLLFAF